MLTLLKLCVLCQVWGAVHKRPREAQTVCLQEVCWSQGEMQVGRGQDWRVQVWCGQGQDQGHCDVTMRRQKVKEGQEVGGHCRRRWNPRGGRAIKVWVRRVQEPSVPGLDGSTCGVDGGADWRGAPDEAGPVLHGAIQRPGRLHPQDVSWGVSLVQQTPQWARDGPGEWWGGGSRGDWPGGRGPRTGDGEGWQQVVVTPCPSLHVNQSGPHFCKWKCN